MVYAGCIPFTPALFNSHSNFLSLCLRNHVSLNTFLKVIVKHRCFFFSF
uniref:Uncharacterized protein n=1 Tax=Arundo donax TaxID=35708 RepID=A0A0A9E6J3_ARUDO